VLLARLVTVPGPPHAVLALLDAAVLTGTRSLKQAADVATAPPVPTPAAPTPDANIASQLHKLVDLHAAGALTDAGFAAAKKRLLS